MAPRGPAKYGAAEAGKVLSKRLSRLFFGRFLSVWRRKTVQVVNRMKIRACPVALFARIVYNSPYGSIPAAPADRLSRLFIREGMAFGYD